MPTFNNKVPGSLNAIEGIALNGRGVVGESTGSEGVRGIGHGPVGAVVGLSDGPAPGAHGGWFESDHGTGVRGVAHGVHGAVVGFNDGTAPGGAGGWFESRQGEGVRATAHTSFAAMVGHNDAPAPGGPAGIFESANGEALRGIGHSPFGAVVGVNDAPAPGGNGGWFESTNGEGVRGVSKSPDHGGVVGINDIQFGVYGRSAGNVGVWGSSVSGEGIHAETRSTTTAALAAFQMNEGSGTAALFARHMGQGTAGHFEGNVVVTGDITLANADCAEDFDVAPDCIHEPGTVMILGEGSALRESARPYDKRVVGVVSGAGSFRPGLVLDRQPCRAHRRSVALLGKVYCKADAGFGPIEIGDLLTTSATPGHAMRVGDPGRAFGTVIGKALGPLSDGRGLIPILIALQ